MFQDLLITAQGVLSWCRFCLPSVEYPSCLQTTLASGTFHRSSHTVPYVLLIQISTLPSVTFVPFTNNTSPLKHAEMNKEENSSYSTPALIQSQYKSFNGVSTYNTELTTVNSIAKEPLVTSAAKASISVQTLGILITNITHRFTFINIWRGRIEIPQQHT